MKDAQLSDDERRAIAKKNYQKKGTHEDMRELNDVLYNAGFGFVAYDVRSNFIQINASFDLSYYVQLELKFHTVCYSDIEENNIWPDAWYDDQIILLTGEDRNRIEKEIQKTISPQALVFQFVELRNRDASRGIIVADEMNYEFI